MAEGREENSPSESIGDLGLEISPAPRADRARLVCNTFRDLSVFSRMLFFYPYQN